MLERLLGKFKLAGNQLVSKWQYLLPSFNANVDQSLRFNYNYNTCVGVGEATMGAWTSASRSTMRSHYLKHLFKVLWRYSTQTLQVLTI